MVLYNVFVLSWGLTITHNSIHTISDLDRSRLSDTRSVENDRIGADTDPEYRIDASLGETRLSRGGISPLARRHSSSIPTAAKPDSKGSTGSRGLFPMAV